MGERIGSDKEYELEPTKSGWQGVLVTEINTFTKQEQLVGLRFYKGKGEDRGEMRLMGDMDKKDLLEFKGILSSNKDIKGNVLPLGANAAGIIKVLDNAIREKEVTEQRRMAKS